MKNISSSIAAWTAQKIHSFIENRGGLAYLVGFILVPSQYLSPSSIKAAEIIEKVRQQKKCRIETFALPIKGSTPLKGVIYYPENWDPQNKSKCLVYHNPNAATVAQYFQEGKLSWSPERIAQVAKCPIILYDYRGTGLSNDLSHFFGFRPTYESIVVDGETVLRHALSQFESVQTMGSSLGGGVATSSLDRHLIKNPSDLDRVSLINHDSFSTTPRVVLPNCPRVADWIGSALGGCLDAETPMKNLINRGIPITVLSHNEDPIIPKGARMADYIKTLPKNKKTNISVMESPEAKHAELSSEWHFTYTT